MTLASDLRAMLPSIRAIPGELGLRPHRVFLYTEAWETEKLGAGSSTTFEIEITEGGYSPKVRTVSDERVAMGNVAPGSIEIGPITPGHVLSEEQLRGLDVGEGETRHVKTIGPTGTQFYSVSSCRMDKALHWTITASPVAKEPDFA